MGAKPIVVNAITLYQLSPIASKWSKTLVEYLTTRVIPEKVSKKWQRYLEKCAQEFSIIANQLYHRSKDGNLRPCVTENEYIPLDRSLHKDSWQTSPDLRRQCIEIFVTWFRTSYQSSIRR